MRRLTVGLIVVVVMVARFSLVEDHGDLTIANSNEHMEHNKPDFNEAVRGLIASIENRDFEQYKAHITKDDTLYTIIQNGHAFTTSKELLAMHEEWFKDPDWIWEGSVERTVVCKDMAMALISYEYRAKKQDAPFTTWLTYVFRLEDNEWRLIHDHNTARDFKAFAKSAGIDM